MSKQAKNRADEVASASSAPRKTAIERQLERESVLLKASREEQSLSPSLELETTHLTQDASPYSHRANAKDTATHAPIPSPHSRLPQIIRLATIVLVFCGATFWLGLQYGTERNLEVPPATTEDQDALARITDAAAFEEARVDSDANNLASRITPLDPVIDTDDGLPAESMAEDGSVVGTALTDKITQEETTEAAPASAKTATSTSDQPASQSLLIELEPESTLAPPSADVIDKTEPSSLSQTGTEALPPGAAAGSIPPGDEALMGKKPGEDAPDDNAAAAASGLVISAVVAQQALPAAPSTPVKNKVSSPSDVSATQPGADKTGPSVASDEPKAVSAKDNPSQATASSSQSVAPGNNLSSLETAQLEQKNTALPAAVLPKRYKQEVAGIILQKVVYPKRAILLQQEGKVSVEILLDRSGKVVDMDIVEDPGYPSLVKAARRAISKAKRLPPLPADYSGETVRVLIPISFKLP